MINKWLIVHNSKITTAFCRDDRGKSNSGKKTFWHWTPDRIHYFKEFGNTWFSHDYQEEEEQDKNLDNFDSTKRDLQAIECWEWIRSRYTVLLGRSHGWRFHSIPTTPMQLMFYLQASQITCIVLLITFPLCTQGTGKKILFLLRKKLKWLKNNYLSTITSLFVIIVYEKVKIFKYLGPLVTNQNSTHDEIKCGLKPGNSYYYSVKIFLSYRLLSFSMAQQPLKSFDRPLMRFSLSNSILVTLMFY